MSQTLKTPRGVTVTLAAGFALGAACMIGFYSGAASRPAFAQTPTLSRTIGRVSTESMAELRNLDASFRSLVDYVSPAVVAIEASTGRQQAADGSRMPAMGGSGSGFIFRPDGYIITNDHVVGGFEKVKVTLKDGRSFDGTVIRAEDSDIAVVRINAKDLPTLAFSDSSQVRPGQMAMAVGAPFGLEQTVTFGHVSAIGRDREIQNKLYPDLIQTDAAINVGNSGGPLVDIEGRVVGVNTAIFSPMGTSAGVGFAIPSNQTRFIADMLIQKGKITRSMIGLYPTNLKEYQKAEMKIEGGALVEQISPGGSAEAAGIQKGDVVTKIGTTPIRSQVDLRNAMLVYAPGTSVPVEIVRNGTRKTVNVKLTEYKRPEATQLQPGRGEFRAPKEFEEFFKDLPKEFQQLKPGPGMQEDDVPPLREGRAILGVNAEKASPELRTKYGIPADVQGAVILEVQPGSVAHRLGLQPGDVVQSLDGKSITDRESLQQAMSGVKWGESKSVKYSRFSSGTAVTTERTVTFR